LKVNRMIRELRTLVAVAREGSFAAAGNKVGLTQAAVSAQMQRLEGELGYALFDREGRSARLNRRGQQTLLRAQELIRLYANLGHSADAPAAAAPIAIGAIASAQRTLLPDALAAFYREHPQQLVRIVPGVSMHLVDLVDAGEIDMAVVIRPPFSMQSDLRWTSLAREPYRLIMPRGTRGDDWTELLASQPFIRYDRHSFGGRRVDHFLRRLHLTVREICEVDERDAIVKLVAQRAGVALIPQTSAYRHWPAGVRAIDLGAQTFHRDVGLVHRQDAVLSAAQQGLAERIVAAASDLGTDHADAARR